MKKLLLLSFLAVYSTFSFAQIRFVSSNKNDMRSLADSLVSNSKREYVFYQQDSSQYAFKLTYVNKQDNEDRVYFDFKIRYIGANKDLETTGTPEYSFYYVSGRFLDIYPFWNKYICVDENRDELLAKGAKFIKKDGKTYLISRSGELWSITIKDY